MKLRQSFKNAVFPLIHNKKKHHSDHSGFTSNDEDSGLENDSPCKENGRPSTSRIRKSVRKFKKNGSTCENASSSSYRRRDSVSSQSSNAACDKLVSCMKKLDRLSKRLDGVSDEADFQQPFCHSQPIYPKQTQQRSRMLKPTWGPDWDHVQQTPCQVYEAFGSDGSSSGYSSTGSWSPGVVDDRSPFAYHNIEAGHLGVCHEQVNGSFSSPYGFDSSAYTTSSVDENALYQSGMFCPPNGVKEQPHFSPVYNTAHLSYYPQPGVFCPPTNKSPIKHQPDFDANQQERSGFRQYWSFRYRNGERTPVATSSVTYGHQHHGFDYQPEQQNNAILEATSNLTLQDKTDEGMDNSTPGEEFQATPLPRLSEQPIYEFPSGHIESSCMCSDCILARMSCQLSPAENSVYY